MGVRRIRDTEVGGERGFELELVANLFFCCGVFLPLLLPVLSPEVDRLINGLVSGTSSLTMSLFLGVL